MIYMGKDSIEINRVSNGFLCYVRGTVEDCEDRRYKKILVFETIGHLIEFIEQEWSKK